MKHSSSLRSAVLSREGAWKAFCKIAIAFARRICARGKTDPRAAMKQAAALHGWLFAAYGELSAELSTFERAGANDEDLALLRHKLCVLTVLCGFLEYYIRGLEDTLRVPVWQAGDVPCGADVCRQSADGPVADRGAAGLILARGSGILLAGGVNDSG